MIVELNLTVNPFRAVLECEKWAAIADYEEARNPCFQPDQGVWITEEGLLRFEGRRHALWADGAADVIAKCCAPRQWHGELWYEITHPVVYETTDECLAWYETADSHRWDEKWAQYAADTIRCESGGSRSRRHG